MSGTGEGSACPICGRAAVAEVRPFCSKRCADLDLARWLNGAYAISAPETDDEAGPGPEPEGAER